MGDNYLLNVFTGYNYENILISIVSLTNVELNKIAVRQNNRINELISFIAMEIADVIFSDIIYTLPENTNVSSTPIHDKVTLLDTTLCDKVCH
jgi:hypothetical protein